VSLVFWFDLLAFIDTNWLKLLLIVDFGSQKLDKFVGCWSRLIILDFFFGLASRKQNV
jgi:hypothetical protein